MFCRPLTIRFKLPPTVPRRRLAAEMPAVRWVRLNNSNLYVPPAASNSLQNAPNAGPGTQQLQGNLNGIPGGVKNSLNVPMPATNGLQNQPNASPNSRAPGVQQNPMNGSQTINSGANNWRYVNQNGQWWYWTPNNTWLYYRGNTWNQYNNPGAGTNQ